MSHIIDTLFPNYISTLVTWPICCPPGTFLQESHDRYLVLHCFLGLHTGQKECRRLPEVPAQEQREHARNGDAHQSPGAASEEWACCPCASLSLVLSVQVMLMTASLAVSSVTESQEICRPVIYCVSYVQNRKRRSQADGYCPCLLIYVSGHMLRNESCNYLYAKSEIMDQYCGYKVLQCVSKTWLIDKSKLQSVI